MSRSPNATAFSSSTDTLIESVRGGCPCAILESGDGR